MAIDWTFEIIVLPVGAVSSFQTNEQTVTHLHFHMHAQLAPWQHWGKHTNMKDYQISKCSEQQEQANQQRFLNMTSFALIAKDMNPAEQIPKNATDKFEMWSQNSVAVIFHSFFSFSTGIEPESSWEIEFDVETTQN